MSPQLSTQTKKAPKVPKLTVAKARNYWTKQRMREAGGVLSMIEELIKDMEVTGSANSWSQKGTIHLGYFQIKALQGNAEMFRKIKETFQIMSRKPTKGKVKEEEE